jgi:predicted metal-dependent enzyme (double-stranded beta helix superfamily)
MFDIERFVAECRAARQEHSPQSAIKEVVARAMARPREVERALGTPQWAEIGTLHRSPELTILKVIWAPGMSIYPHDHRMWAVIGLYGGREDNVFYRRSAQGLEQAGGKQLDITDTTLLGQTIIHAVTNPLRQFTGAIHVYGGDFFAVLRSEWDPDTFAECPYDVEHAKRVFVEANERWRAQSAER